MPSSTSIDPTDPRSSRPSFLSSPAIPSLPSSMAFDGSLPRDLDDSISAMIFSMIGHPSAEEQLRFELSLSQTSVRILHSQIRESQAQYRLLERKYQASQSEALLNESALKEKTADLEALRDAYDQLLEECELFRTDREVFAEAAEDSEERRAEAEKRAEEAEARAAEAEVRAAEAERKELEATSFIKTLLMASPVERLKILAKARETGRWGNVTITHNKKPGNQKKKDPTTATKHSDTAEGPNLAVTTAQASSTDVVNSPNSTLHKEGRGMKRVLLDASGKQRGCRNPVRQRTGNKALVERRPRTPICKATVLQAFSTDEKENFGDLDIETRTRIEEATLSDNETTRFLVHLLVVLKRNLVKAETEGDILFRKCCEMQKLLRETHILPEMLEGNTASGEVVRKEHANEIENV